MTHGRRAQRGHSGVVAIAVLAFACLAGLSYFGYARYRAAAAEDVPATPARAPAAVAPPTSFTCDGRRYCAEMRSCAEAKFFLKNCPATEMDTNRDGVPCEHQWCTGG